MLKFVIILILPILIGASVFYLIKNYSKSFTSDTNELLTIPPDVTRVENRISHDPLFATSSANPLTEKNLTTASISGHFRIPIFLYHYVEHVKDRNDKVRLSLNILPEILDTQIKTLKDNGYTFLTPAEIPGYFQGGKWFPSKPVILSFDDGYRDFYSDVFPILKKYQTKAVIYVVSGFLDKSNNLTHEQLKEISNSGLVEIGAHTVNHVSLRGMDSKKALIEISKSKIDLEKELGINVISFAYPYGAFDLRTIKLVQQAGFYTAASTIPGTEVNLDNLYFLYRLRPGSRVGQSLLDFTGSSTK